jgi:hypothetical protein
MSGKDKTILQGFGVIDRVCEEGNFSKKGKIKNKKSELPSKRIFQRD